MANDTQRQQLLPGLIGRMQRWGRIGWAVAAVLMVYVLIDGWRDKERLATAKLDCAQGRVYVLDGRTGDDVPVALQSEDDWRLTDGMVYERLGRVVKCMRGLESKPEKVRACWAEITPMFVGDAARRFNQEATSILGKSPTDLAARMLTEHVAVERREGDWKAGSDRFGLHWREFGVRGNKLLDERWNGSFTVKLVERGDASRGLQITDYTWEQDRI